MSDVGFIGLGTMGAPMAGHLQTGGHRLFVHSRSHVPDSVTAGGKAWDHSAMLRALEIMANFQIGQA